MGSWEEELSVQLHLFHLSGKQTASIVTKPSVFGVLIDGSQ